MEIGLSGLRGGGDDFQSTEFLLSHTTEALDVNTFFPTFTGIDEFVVAVRGTSVGPNREGSSKTGGGLSGGGSAVVPEPASASVWLSGVALCVLLRKRK